MPCSRGLGDIWNTRETGKVQEHFINTQISSQYVNHFRDKSAGYLFEKSWKEITHKLLWFRRFLPTLPFSPVAFTKCFSLQYEINTKENYSTFSKGSIRDRHNLSNHSLRITVVTIKYNANGPSLKAIDHVVAM